MRRSCTSVALSSASTTYREGVLYRQPRLIVFFVLNEGKHRIVERYHWRREHRVVRLGQEASGDRPKRPHLC